MTLDDPTLTGGDDAAYACELPATNLDARGIRQRRVLGWLSFAAGAAALAWLLVADVPRGWRLALFAPFMGGALGVLQARART